MELWLTKLRAQEGKREKKSKATKSEMELPGRLPIRNRYISPLGWGKGAGVEKEGCCGQEGWENKAGCDFGGVRM
jgi:hypothetical protein